MSIATIANILPYLQYIINLFNKILSAFAARWGIDLTEKFTQWNLFGGTTTTTTAG